MSASKLSLFVLLTIVFTSCQKEKSSVYGNVTYIHNYFKTEYQADNAHVKLYKDESMTSLVAETDCDHIGNYFFKDVAGGDYYIHADVVLSKYSYAGGQQIMVASSSNSKYNFVIR
jgi:hypothetical protein